MCSDDENQFQTRLAHVRTCFQHYFENFEEKVEIGHFGFWHPYGKSIGVPKAKVTDLNFFLKTFKIMLKTCSYIHVLSVFEIDFHHLNTFYDVFLVGQSLVILNDFYVFPYYYT